MTPHSLRVLEFDAVRQRLAGLTTFSLGRELALALEPSPHLPLVRRLQEETAEATRLLDLPGAVPFGGLHDVRGAVRTAAIGGLLEPHALLEVRDTLTGARRLRAHLLQRQEAAPALAEWAHRVSEYPHLEQAITEAIDDHADVRDDASPVLQRVRKELRALRARITERLQSIIRSPAYRDLIQEPVVTLRDGRFCVPVKSECRSQFGGLVHDQSTSGATVFMEPQSVVELGNEVRQAEARERQEVERILRELGALIGARAEDLHESLTALGALDLIFARARLGQALAATAPEVGDGGRVSLRRARHPLLPDPVVPIDVELGGEFNVLVITGPNTGGKTVALKTVGLLALMAQSGLAVPAADGAVLPVFAGIYADIGDEQSIQQSLSTFSGHVRNIAGILEAVARTGPRSLVLLDEMGAGTDPTEGAALAKAILSHLLSLGARVIATTHYGELKEFAYSTPGVENASVEFDERTLRPTYRLLIGVPGASNAFSIAGRLGLPEGIIEAARGLIGTDRATLADVLQRLTAQQRAAEADLRKAEQAAREADEKRTSLDRELRQARTDRADTLRRAQEEAEELRRGARRQIANLRDELRRIERQTQRLGQGTESPAAPADLQKLRDRLERAEGRTERRPRKVRVAPEPEAAPLPPDVAPEGPPPAAGDAVWVAGLDQRGTLLSASGDRAQVRIGSMRTTVPAADVHRLRAPASPGPARPSGGARLDEAVRARGAIASELLLVGLRAEEARERLDRYVDEACLAGLSPLRIVHGRGTGALKKLVWELLRAHPHVAEVQHPAEEDGGSAVTLAELK
jgi:DNA mismatch repair protein MutS2